MNQSKLTLNAILFVLSIGWLIPMAISLFAYDSWIWKDILPIIYRRTESEMHILPYYMTSRLFMIIGFTWLSVVVTGWGIYFAFYLPFLKQNKPVKPEE
ncbi:MAG: hypothetical protein EP297_03650 [Gammaproteobacteria bacterium]|nr:MAG: hypothetical protein EP297_03650 [Gammaproteobacteria bacterium]